jgi:hypothetical protein
MLEQNNSSAKCACASRGEEPLRASIPTVMHLVAQHQCGTHESPGPARPVCAHNTTQMLPASNHQQQQKQCTAVHVFTWVLYIHDHSEKLAGRRHCKLSWGVNTPHVAAVEWGKFSVNQPVSCIYSAHLSLSRGAARDRVPRVLGKSCVSAHNKLQVNTPPMLAAVAQNTLMLLCILKHTRCRVKCCEERWDRLWNASTITAAKSHPLSPPCLTPTTCNPK